MVAVQRVSCENSKYRFSSQIFNPFKVFQKSESVIRTVSPRTVMSRTFIGITDSGFPVKAIGKSITCHIVSSGEAKKFRIHVLHHGHEIRAKSVSSVVVGWGKESYP